ncbi:MAG: cytochrome-c oxidase, cbb3-type subunit III [Neomegalonema sp.]|nr:cytochrome-c oxidase, cbb3-type subunit III [Neomegalonema sp.]
MAGPELDEVTGTYTTGHEWDGVKELNNPLPRWWVSVFYACILFSIGFCIAYPAWPLITEHTKGVLGYSTRNELLKTVAAHSEMQSEWRTKIAAAELEEIKNDPELNRFATRAGAAAFAVNCSQCHGSGAQGFVGYPNLNDDDWLWGGTLEEIHTTITHGVRNTTDDDARYSEMPAFGEILEKEQIDEVANYVLSLGNLEHDASKAAAGQEVYVDNCEACHGESGEGDIYQGAPKLADAIWLFKGDIEHIKSQISEPAHGVMPAWGQRLDEVTVKELAVYVHGLGGGQ